MRTKIFRVVSLALLFLTMAGIKAWAQFDFTALDGLPTAQGEADAALGVDAYPVLIGAPGDFNFQGFPLKFDLESGRSSVWGYVFYSPSKQEFASFVVVRLLGYQAFALGALPFPIPVDLLAQLNTTGHHADSDQMIVRLETDTAYQHYRSDLPESRPTFLTLTQLLDTNSLELPNGFPVGQGTWTVSFQGGGDSTMTCFVASETGEAFCRRIYGLPTSGVDEPSSSNSVPTLLVSPNPAIGLVVVAVSGIPTSELTQGRLLLYNDAGKLVLDLTESFSANHYSQATFSAALLSPGHYHCALVGPTTKEHVGVVVVE